MRKMIMIIIVITSFVFVSCNGNSKKEEQEKMELNNEISSIDSTTVKLQTAKNEIETSSKKLDELLKDL